MKTKTPRTKKPRALMLRVPAELSERLAALKEASGMTMQSIGVRALEAWVQQQANTP